MTSDVLALIDGAISDWEMSGDAMRWQPEKPPADWTPSPQHIAQMRAYMDDFNARWVPVQQGLMDAFRHIGEQLGQMAPVVKELGELLGGLAPATRGATSPRVPAYRDARPRWQSPYGPQRAR